MSSKKKDKRKRKYSSSSSGSDSSSSSSSSSGSSSSSHSSQNKDSSHKPATSPGARKSADPSSAGLDCVSAMFLDTKPDELIDQIFIILDDAEIKELCPTILKHMSIPDLKEKALCCVSTLDDTGLQGLYTNQEVDPGAEEIDKALLQLGLVGNSTALLERDTNKWKSVPEEAEPPVGEEAGVPEEEEEGAIFTEVAENKEPDRPKRKLLADTPADSADDAEAWRALLMRDKVRMSMKLDTTNVIASNLSDKPMDFVPEETTIRRRNDEGSSGGSRPLSPGSSREDSPVVVGNPPLAIGNPPLAEEPEKPKLSYRQRAAAAAAAEEEEEDKISAADMVSGSESDSESSSSEEGEISDDDEEDEGAEKEERVEVKNEPSSPSNSLPVPRVDEIQRFSAPNSPRHSSSNTPKGSASNSPYHSAQPSQPDGVELTQTLDEPVDTEVKTEVEEEDSVSDLYAL